MRNERWLGRNKQARRRRFRKSPVRNERWLGRYKYQSRKRRRRKRRRKASVHERILSKAQSKARNTIDNIDREDVEYKVVSSLPATASLVSKGILYAGHSGRGAEALQKLGILAVLRGAMLLQRV